MGSDNIHQIAIIGSSNVSDKKVRTLAYKIGAEIAKNNYILICGGKGGVMELASKGAKEHGGLTVGILPENDLSFSNPYIDVKIATGIGHARNSLVVRSAEVIIAIGGSSGTLSEMAHAKNESKSLIILKNSRGISDYVICNNFKYLDYEIAKDPKEAINIVDKIIKSK